MENPFEIMDKRLRNLESLILEIRQSNDEIKQKFEPKSPAEYLTRTEVSTMLKCNLATVHNWTKQGKLIPYGIGNRVYYKRHEVESVLVRFGK